MLTGKPHLGHLEPAAAIYRIGSEPTKPTLPTAFDEMEKNNCFTINRYVITKTDEKKVVKGRFTFLNVCVENVRAAGSIR